MEMRSATTDEERTMMTKYGHIVMSDEQPEDWYESLADDCRQLAKETVSKSRWTLIEGYWQLGQRIRQDSGKWEQGKSLEVLQRLQKDTGVGQRTLYYATQFYDKYPTMDAVNSIPDGENLSWNKVKDKYLGDLHPHAKVLPDTFDKPKEAISEADAYQFIVDKILVTKSLKFTFEFGDQKFVCALVQEKVISENGAQVNQLIELFAPINPSYEILFRRKPERDATERLLVKYGFEKTQEIILGLKEIFGMKYAPRVTTPVKLEEKLGEVIAFVKSKGGQNGRVAKIR